MPISPIGNETSITVALLAWSATSGRRPPWRTVPALYPLAVAEILLQKTKGHDVEPVWRALIDAFPDAAVLASASDTAVYDIVAPLGLGFQRTARLKALAAALVAPNRPAKLPALGPYGTAIMALATGTEPPVAPVDGNVARVITRLYGMTFDRGEPRKKPDVRAAAAGLLATLVEPSRKLMLVYALVDLGAALCTPHQPACPGCPLLSWCISAPNRPAV